MADKSKRSKSETIVWWIISIVIIVSIVLVPLLSVLIK
jgi:predicted nucleic acid-binding Zn ribbon protein